MSSEEIQAAVVLLATALKVEMITKNKQQKKRKPRSVWVREWIKRRNDLGASGHLLKELRDEDPTSYRNILRMNTNQFDVLHSLVYEELKKADTTMRMAIPVHTKLEITLRYLATGDSFKSLEYLFRVPQSTISKFLPDVLSAIKNVLQQFIQVPKTEEQWKEVQQGFLRKWNFPNCLGAIDGKHILIKRPPCSGSEFFNYKKTYSVILFAMVDADYCFTYVDIGGNGRASDSAIFRDSALNIAIENNALNVPKNGVLIGDDAFPLRTNLMKPYSRSSLDVQELVFNYRLSRAQRVVENVFGILVWRFRVFSRPIELKLSTIDKVIWAACSLHNWLRKTNPSYLPQNAVDREDFNSGDITPGQWRETAERLLGVTHIGSNNYSRSAEDVRKQLSKYFTEENPLPWQWQKIGVN